MLHQMRYSVLTVVLACVVLFRITPAVAWPRVERLHGTMWSFSQVVRSQLNGGMRGLSLIRLLPRLYHSCG